MPKLNIEGAVIDHNSDCYVVAEIGHNHQGSLELAKELIFEAKECGASAVKLQKRDNRNLYTKAMFDQPYDHENSFGPTYGLHREALEFGEFEYRELQQYAAELGISLFATAFDFESADFLEKLDMPAYKIASGDLRNTPLLRHVAQIGKPMIVSTGGATLDDVKRAYDTIKPINSYFCIMQCTANYPAEPEDLNLQVISSFQETFPSQVIGLSDHQNGIAMALVAYVLGARVIEKHFTLNRAMKGTDHAFSLTPDGLSKMVRDLRRARVAQGDGVKASLPSETKPLYKMGKKLVAARDLPAGKKLDRDDIAIKSPNDGLPPFQLDKVLGQVTKRALGKDENVMFEDLTGA